MRIAFDGRVIRGRKCGVGVYADSLLNALTSIDKSSIYKIFSHDSFKFSNKNFKSVTTRVSIEDHPLGDIWEQFYLPVYLRDKKIDIVHSPTFHIPFLFSGFKKVVTIHDLVSFRSPQTQPKPFAVYSRFMTRFAVNSAHGIIVPSRTVKSELIGLLNVRPELLHVIPEAPRGIFKPVGRAVCDTIRKKYNLNERFILSVGSIEPRKNITSLIQAYSALKRKGAIQQKLVICGAKGWLNEYERLEKSVNESGVKGDIIFTGYVPDEDLPAMYTLADLFAYPSLYEGFGLPPLEAFACGCPVIASNCSSIPEVVGDAGLLVDPLDIDGLSNAIHRVLGDDSERERLRDAGFKRARQFSWERTARETLETYRTIVNRA
ncbi:MAG: glycosyltransferase family 4 protein [Deltaproteobacteria bacterium]|nr:glycosyltransferase family 4 protein [Deltaproteobacteria bacterium]